VKGSEFIREREKIRGKAYFEYLKRADPRMKTVKSLRTSLIHNGLCMIIDEKMNVEGKPVILTTATDVESSEISFPDFIKVFKEINPRDPIWSNQYYKREGFRIPSED
jgi:hypothetical protein